MVSGSSRFLRTNASRQWRRHWLAQRGVVAIPKSVRPERIKENIGIFDFTLTDDELAQIATLDTGKGFFNHFDPNIVAFFAKRTID